jgi:hypothetical protein
MTAAHGTPESHDEQDHAPDHGAPHDAGTEGHHEDGSLGPVDWRMWGVGVLGTLVAAVIVAAAVLATDFVFLAGAAPTGH